MFHFSQYQKLFYLTGIAILITVALLINNTIRVNAKRNNNQSQGMLEKGNDTNTVVIGFAGDVMIGRLVNEQIRRTNYSYPWGNVLTMLKKTDFNIINLETTLTTSEDRMSKVFNFKSDPEHAAVLTAARISAVTIANNHILDFGIRGMKETIAVLDKAGIPHTGAGNTIFEAVKPVILKKNNLRIGMLGFTDNEPGWAATENSPGINFMRVGEIEKIKNEVDKLRNDVDLLIVSLHWGPNMRKAPTAEFISFAHQLIDLGVDIIHGHSAHIFQGIEWYKEKLILYDCGNFVDDYRVDPILQNDHSFLFLCQVGKKEIRRLQLIPVLISDMQVNLAKGADYEWCIKRMQTLSAPFGTKILHTGEVER